jgi:PhnB protein
MKAKPKKRVAKKAAARKAPAKKAVRPIPEGHPAVSPYLIVDDAARALEFYKKAFSAKELMRHAGPDGRIGHAEIRLGDSVIMLADEHPEVNARSPKTIGGSPVSLHVYVKDVDAAARQATNAGARVVRPVQNQFYGDRSGTLEDPFGHQWHLSTHIEDVSPAELRRRAAQAGH